MGVQGLWQLLDTLGRPVSLESLENKILAIDASIWLHQAVHGFRDKSNNPLPNAHLLGLFHRVCKLLFYGIKPVFVFDGAVPFLKKQTMAKRRDRQQNASRDAEKTYHQILHKCIQSKAIKEVLGEKESTKADANSSTLSDLIPKRQITDLYDLPPLTSMPQPEITAPRLEANSDDGDDENYDDFHTESMNSRISAYQDVDTIDFEADDFKSLPLDIQHELLLEMKERNKRRYWLHHEPLPEKAEEIGNFQIKQLLYRRKLQSKIESINRDLSASLTSDLASEQGLGAYGDKHVLESRRISSEDSARYILFKSIRNDLSKPKLEFPIASTASSSVGINNSFLKSNMENPVTLSRNVWLKSITAAPISSDKLHIENDLETIEEVAPASDFVPFSDSTVKFKSDSSMMLDNWAALKQEHSADNSLNIQDAFNRSSSINSATTLSTCDISKKKSSEAEDYSLTPVMEDNICNLTSVQEDMLKSESIVLCDEQSFVQPIADSALVLKEKLNHPPLNPLSKPKSDTISMVQLMSSSDDDDDNDFIEVEINPKKIEDDELFPFDVFQNNSIDSKTNVLESLNKSDDILDGIERMPVGPEFEIIPFQDRTDLLHLSEELERQTETLVQDKGRQERIAATITEQMYSESQELLKLFGIPFVISPAEAEAQCATMDMLNLTDGTITDDSDVWLFGAKVVYKNFFENKRDVLFFSQADVLKRLRLDRSKLIAVALLTGSDYTEGIKGVGIVTAMEILAEFKEDDGFESLQQLSAWWNVAQEQKVAPSETKVKQKIRKLILSQGFPNNDVLKAYLEPLVDSSKESFSWAHPNIDALRHFANCKLNWTKEKTDGMLFPIIKRMNAAKERQIRIDSFFPAAMRNEQRVKHQSRRLKRALIKVGSLADSQEAGGSGQSRKNMRAKRGDHTSRRRNRPIKAELAEDLGLSESSDTASSEEACSTPPSKQKSLPKKGLAIDISVGEFNYLIHTFFPIPPIGPNVCLLLRASR